MVGRHGLGTLCGLCAFFTRLLLVCHTSFLSVAALPVWLKMEEENIQKKMKTDLGLDSLINYMVRKSSVPACDMFCSVKPFSRPVIDHRLPPPHQGWSTLLLPGSLTCILVCQPEPQAVSAP